MPKYIMTLDIEFESEDLESAFERSRKIEEYIYDHPYTDSAHVWNIEEFDTGEFNENLH